MQAQKSQNELPSVPQKKSFFKGLLFVLKNMRPLWQARQEGSQAEHAEETLNTHLRDAGVPEEGIKFFKAYFLAWRKARRDDVAFHTVDRYLVGGVGILDLVLLQLLVSIGVPDLSSSLAWIAFTVSLPCTVGSLFSSFVKKENRITAYGRVHSTLSGLSLLMAIASLTAIIWHVWFIAGLIFLCVAIATFIICLFYETLVALGKYFRMDGEDTKPVQTPDEQATPASAAIKPVGPED